MPDGSVGAPCGACRELLMQLDKDSKNIEILMNSDTFEVVSLETLCPKWWTDKRFNKNT